MGVRAFLREMRKRFESQEEMAEYLSKIAGKRIRQSTLSCWLNDIRYPDRESRRLIKEAFQVPDRRWRSILWADEVGEQDARDTNGHQAARMMAKAQLRQKLG